MAVAGKRRSKTNVFWVRDRNEQDENIVKLHIPGLMLESSSDVQRPMVRKPIHMIKPNVVTLQKSFNSSLKRRQQSKEAALAPNGSRHEAHSFSASSVSDIGTNNKEESDKSKRHFSLKELNPEDKKRVANLVKELAKAGEERHRAERRLQEERTAFEERLAIIQDEYDGVIKEKQYMQKRFLELQSLLVKYQSNGRMPSPKKTVGSQGVGTKNNGKDLHSTFSVSPSLPSHVQHLEESSPVQILGNDRPDKGRVRTVTGNTEGLPQTLPREETNVGRVILEGVSPQKMEAVNSRSSPFKGSITPNKQLTISDKPAGSCLAKLNASQEDNRKRTDVTESSTNGTPSMSQATGHIDGQSVVRGIPHSLGLKEELPYIPSKPSAVKSLSELSVVSGNFSAELDAMYRLYCREYELQLQLQQQQIELQRQQLQLQQQLQQVEVLQQQQNQHQLQQQPPTDSQPVPSEIPRSAGVNKQAKPSICEAPNPTVEPGQLSHTRSPIPTSEDRSVIPSDHHISVIQVAAPLRTESRLHVVHSQHSARRVVSTGDNDQQNSRIGKENRDSLAEPVPPYLDRTHPALRCTATHQGDFKESAGESKRNGVVSDHESSQSSPRSAAEESTVISRSGVQSRDARHSLRESWREESMSGDILLPKARARLILSTGRNRSVPRSQEEVFVQGKARCNQANFSTLSEQSSIVLRETRREPLPALPYAMHSQSREEFRRDTGDSELRYSLYTGVGQFEKKPRGLKTLENSPDVDEFMSSRQGLEMEGSRDHLQGTYPRSLVDIVECLEDTGIGRHTSFSSTPRLSGGLDTSDSGYSPERSSKDTNTDEEEATVLEEIFFLPGRF